MTVVLYYHELSDDDSPLSVSPELFSDHLEVLDACGADVITAAQLARALGEDGPPERTVVITFDDGFAAAVREAGARLAKAGMRATFYCVAGYLGRESSWPTQPPGALTHRLASAEELAALAEAGHEIGSHGWSHAPLDREADLRREIVESRSALADATGAEIVTFAYPYGARPTPAARALVAETYAAGFGTTVGRLRRGAPTAFLPRVDAHYVRDPRVLRRVVSGSYDAYLGLRRIGSRTRRTFRKDYTIESGR